MVFLSEDVLDLNDRFSREDITYTFTNGIPSSLTTAVTGGASITAANYSDPLGSALKMTLGSSGDTAEVRGPLVDPSAVRAVLIDAEGVSHYSAAGTQNPIWRMGLYQLSGAWDTFGENLYDTGSGYGGVIQSANASGSGSSQVAHGTAAMMNITNYDKGLLVDFSRGKVTGHMSHQYGAMTDATKMPTGALYFKVMALAGGGVGNNFSVYFRKITLSIWR